MVEQVGCLKSVIDQDCDCSSYDDWKPVLNRQDGLFSPSLGLNMSSCLYIVCLQSLSSDN